jgi:hypothetical protein
MTAHRATILAAGAAILALTGGPAAAQVAPDIVMNIMRECSRIHDPTSRLACYDNNNRSAGGVARTSVPGQMARPQGPAASNPVEAFGLPTRAGQASGGAGGFGGETIRTPSYAAAPSSGGKLDRITPKVAAAVEREPGVYLVTLDDGAQWQFAQGVSSGYRAPARGSTVEIERGSLGSYLMRVDGQQPVQVRRVR